MTEEGVDEVREGLEHYVGQAMARPTVGPDPVNIPMIRHWVDALDDRISAEAVEREEKLLEEIRRGMRGLETELSERFAAATLGMKRSSQRNAALVVGFVALLSGLVVGVLSGL